MSQLEIESDFPLGAPVKGKVYVMDHNYRLGALDSADDHTVRIIIMSEDSWGDFGTTMESMRQALAAQDARIKELLAIDKARDRLLADTMSRLEALRTVRRAEKRPEIEADMNLPTV